MVPDVKEDGDEELKRLRMKRMMELLEKQQRLKKLEEMRKNEPTREQKIDMILRVILTPDAYSYLMNIKNKNSDLYARILSIILPPAVMAQLDLLYTYLNRGMLRRGLIKLIDIKYLERKILGIGPQISVKRPGEEPKSLGDFLKEEL